MPRQNHAVILFPFWGKNPEIPGDPNNGRFDRYAALGREFFELVPLEEADVAVLPGEWDPDNTKFWEFCQNVRNAEKRTCIFFCSDSAENIDVPDSIVLRTSLYHSTRQTNEYAMPAWSEDFVSAYLDNHLPVRQKNDSPVVGFCGQPGPIHIKDKIRCAIRRGMQSSFRVLGSSRVSGKLKILGMEQGPFRGLDPSSVRAKALLKLLKSSLLTTHFEFTRGHFDGPVLFDGRLDCNLARHARQKLLNNMIDCDYIVCARGGGNFSYRLYETLCCGRIPVFVNTDCVLPYEEHIEWKKYCV